MTSTIDTNVVVIDPMDQIIPPPTVIQPLSQVGPSRLVASYPWGMPHNYSVCYWESIYAIPTL